MTSPDTAAAEPSAEPTPLRRPAPDWAMIGVFLLLSVGALATARDFLMPVILAFILALTFSPVRRFLDRRGLPSGVSALLIFAMLGALLLGAVALLAAPAQTWIDQAPQMMRELEWKLRGLADPAETVMEAGEKVQEMAGGGKEAGVQEVEVQKRGLFASAAFGAPLILGQAVFTLVLLLFLLSSGDMFYEKIVHALPSFRDKRRAISIAFDIERKLSRYLFTITVINAGLGLCIGLSMWALGMPNPALMGAVAFGLNFMPYFGAVAGAALAVLAGLVTYAEPTHALLPGAAYMALTALEGQIVTPYFVGRRLELNTVVIFISIAFWAWLWSVVGMLLAVPLLVAVRAFCEHIPSLHALGDFLSARGVETNGRGEGNGDRPRPEGRA